MCYGILRTQSPFSLLLFAVDESANCCHLRANFSSRARVREALSMRTTTRRLLLASFVACGDALRLPPTAYRTQALARCRGMALCTRTTPMRFVGHRGASHVRPEQTMAAVMDALDQGLSFECDLQVLRTSEVVLLHDDTLERTAAKWSTDTNATGLDETEYAQLVTAPASTLSYDELSRVDIGSWFDTAHSEERVPLFSQALQALKETGGDACCFAELKSVDDKEDGTASMPESDRQLVEAAVAVAGETGLRAEQLTWISFSRAVACEAKRRMPEHNSLLIKHAQTSEAAWQAARDCVEYGLDGIDLECDAAVVTPELVAWMHARGKLVAVWVWRAPAANDTPEHWAAMRAAGVDYFTSNLPSELEGVPERCRA